jgi:hypothetical protein
MTATLPSAATACRRALWVPILLLAAGCNGGHFELAPVHGTVTVDDIPLAGCNVRFAPIAKGDDVHPGKPAYGRIQTDGKYRLTTRQANDGAVVGEHWVTIMNVQDDLPDGVPEFGRITVPEKATVISGQENEVNIKLTKEVVRKHREDDT